MSVGAGGGSQENFDEAVEQALQITASVGDYLKRQGYSGVAEVPVEDDNRVALMGRKEGETVVAEIRLDAGIVDERAAIRMARELKAIVVTNDTRKVWIIVLPAPASADDAAHRVLAKDELRLLKVDPESGEVATL